MFVNWRVFEGRIKEKTPSRDWLEYNTVLFSLQAHFADSGEFYVYFPNRRSLVERSVSAFSISFFLKLGQSVFVK